MAHCAWNCLAVLEKELEKAEWEKVELTGKLAGLKSDPVRVVEVLRFKKSVAKRLMKGGEIKMASKKKCAMKGGAVKAAPVMKKACKGAKCAPAKK